MQPVATDEYSLWIEPKAAEAHRYRTVIEDIARRAITPRFTPHLTLLPNLHGDEPALIQKLKQLAHVGFFTVPVGEVRAGDKYHKCLYLECALTEPLAALRAQSEVVFGSVSDFKPHISLAYGLDKPLCDALTLELAEKKFSFTAQGVSLWHAKGLPNEWRKVAAVLLV